MSSNHRSRNGKFAKGNPGGPGRPRRAIERDYLAALSEAVSLDTWKEIVAGTVEAAKSGDAKARDWLARYLLGNQPPTLTRIAADEVADPAGDAEIVKILAKQFHDESNLLDDLDDDDFERAERQLKNFKRRHANGNASTK